MSDNYFSLLLGFVKLRLISLRKLSKNAKASGKISAKLGFSVERAEK